MTDMAHILKEIQRTASENGGIALGHRRFASETGIKEHPWRGRHWSKWSDALTEAGLEPSQKQLPIEEAVLLKKLVTFVIRDVLRSPSRIPPGRRPVRRQ